MIRLAALALAAAAQGAAAPAAECRLGLALALDVSSSVDAAEYAIQIGGLAAAFRDAEVREAILEEAEVRALVYEWSGYYQQDIVADWTPLTSPADIDALAARLERHRRVYSVYPTAIGRAVRYGAEQLGRLAPPCARRVIDVSGDGEGNLGPSPLELRRGGALEGITVNGLVIRGATPDPEPYYREQVVGGPGAFLMVAEGGFDDYPAMIREKLLRELRPEIPVGALQGTLR